MKICLRSSLIGPKALLSKPLIRAPGLASASGSGGSKVVTEEEGGVRKGVTIMVDGTKTTKGGAAYANAEMALAGGKWDTFRMLTHPGTYIVPAAFAAAEAESASGKDFITALVAG